MQNISHLYDTHQYKSLPNRIKKELLRLESNNNPDFIYKINPENLRHVFIDMKGPDNTCYSNGIFKLELFIPKGYPYDALKVRFLTKVYHPNIDFIGRICLDILKNRWTPALQIQTVLLSIQVLLSSPNLEDPLNIKVSEHWRDNPEDAYNVALSYTQKYAI